MLAERALAAHRAEVARRWQVSSMPIRLDGHRLWRVLARYSDLVRAFGLPLPGDQYKISAEWYFRGDDGSVFWIYDYKRTSLYNTSLRTPTALNKLPVSKVLDWHVGGATQAGGRGESQRPHAFLEWLSSQVSIQDVPRAPTPPSPREGGRGAHYVIFHSENPSAQWGRVYGAVYDSRSKAISEAELLTRGAHMYGDLDAAFKVAVLGPMDAPPAEPADRLITALRKRRQLNSHRGRRAG